MPNYGSSKQNTGGRKISDGTDGNYDMGQQSGFGNKKGANNKRSLVNDSGQGGGKFVDTDNDQSGSGFGGGLKKPRAGDA